MEKDKKTELDSLRIFRHVLFGILAFLTLFAIIVLITHPEMNFKFTLLPGAVIIGSLTLTAILVREMVEHTKLRREVDQAQSLYTEVFEKTSDAIYIIDLGGRIESINIGFEILIGFSKKEIVGHLINDFVHKDDSHLIDFNYAITPKSESRKYDIRFVNKEKEIRFVFVRETPVYRSGICVGYQAIATDITERKQAEESLKRERNLFRVLIDNLPDAIYVKDTECRKTIANIADVRNIGKQSEAEVLGRTDFDFYPEDIATGFYADDLSVIKSGKSVTNKEEFFFDKDGKKNWLQTFKLPMRDEQGSIIGLIGIERKITEQKRAMEALTLLSHTVKCIGESISITDLKNNILFVNEAFLKTYGYTEQEIIGKPIKIVANYPAIENQMILDETIKGGWQGELLNRKKDGTVFSIFLSTSIVNDEKGQPIGLVGVATDITERKIAQEELQKERNLLRMVIDNLPDGIYTKDLNCRKTLTNKTDVYNMGRESDTEVLGKDDYDLFPKDMADKFITDDRYVIQTGRSVIDREEYVVDAKGQKHFLLTTKLPFRDEQGQIIGLIGIGHDVTERKRTEEALQESNEKLRNIVENSTNLFYSRNTDQVFTYLSPQARDIFDCEPDEAIVPFTDFMTDNVINKLGCELAKKAIQTGARQETYELELISRKGRRVWVEIQEAPVVKEGKTISIVGAATDITERRWAEMALQVSEKKYRDMVEWAPVGIYQSTFAGKLLSANGSIAEMLGYENVNELVGCNMGQDIYYDEKDREYFIAENDSSEKKATLSHETRWKTKNGSIIWVLITVHDVRDKLSEILYYEGFVFDITERKHAEEALRESEERYRLLVENSTDIVTEISAEDKYLYVSPNVKSILDFEPMDLVGTDVLSRVYGKDKAIIGEILSKLGGSAMYRYRDRIGSWHWFESSGRVYYTSSGEQRMVMVSRDITQRRNAEQELELSRKQLQHFTEHLEHVLEEERKRISRELHDELGQLLTILKFDISWLRLEGVKSDSEAIAKIDAMMESVNEALASVKRIAKEIRPPQLDALGLVGAIQWDIDQAEKKTGLKGVVNVEPAEFEIKGQISTVLYRVFREALTNILRHSQAKQIFVRLMQRSDSVSVTIRDDGRGITKKELKGTTSLGLIGIRERIRMVGGTLTIEGKTGSGTVLSVEVPLKKKNGDSVT